MIAAGQFDGLMYLEDALDIVQIMVGTKRMPDGREWIVEQDNRPTHERMAELGLF